MSLADINVWFSANQLVVTFVIMPVVSALAAWYSARKAMASARTERLHQSVLEIGSYRQAWIDALRDDLAEFAGISAIAYEHRPMTEKVERIALLSMRIRMRMNNEDPDYKELVEILVSDTETYLLGKSEKSRIGQPIVLVTQRILKREWEKLRADLRKAAS